MSKKTTLLTLAALVIALAVPATASAFYAAPYNGIDYFCYSPDWSVVSFSLPTSGTIRHGLIYINGDNKKFTLAKPVNLSGGTSWEGTFPKDNLQCKDTFVTWNRRTVVFDDCTDGVQRICAF